MFAIPGILALLVFVYVRPQEFFVALRQLPFLYLFLGLALFGLVLDLKLRLRRLELAPQLGWALLFAAWCVLTLAVRAPKAILPAVTTFGVSLVLFVLLAHAVQTFRALELVAGTLLCCVLFLCVVGIHQGLSPFGCVVVDESRVGDTGAVTPDGRPCQTMRDCENEDAEPGADYTCEKVGLFGTTTIGHGRIRYIGILQDPNELSLVCGIALPFAFAFAERKKTPARVGLLLLTSVMVVVTAIMTESRGGQLVFLAVLGVYFVRRYGVKGLLVGAVLAAPILLFGGRTGESAESSSLERLEHWYEGVSMFKQYPVLGVGQGQFVEHDFGTAHNSYVLAPAELGLPGMIFWSIVLYISTKIPVVALGRYAQKPEAAVARTWALALLSSLCGLLVGIFFLSFCYHNVLWIYVGLCGAFYMAARTHDPTWRLRFGLRDLLAVVGIDLTLIVILYAYTRLKAP